MNLKRANKLTTQAKPGSLKSKVVNPALAEFGRRQRMRILNLAGKIDFHPDWNKKMRRGKL
ncbi:MAG TPA: hypothetical protein VN281_23260 [Verrucomicrobiae bacterium]|nr:hypothetical protein [Verrucomicrobiae bacterium]